MTATLTMTTVRRSAMKLPCSFNISCNIFSREEAIIRRRRQSRLLFSSSSSSSSSNNADERPKFYDVAIVGGGAVGATLAHSLQRKISGLKVALIESRGATTYDFATATTTAPHPRSYALSPRSLSILGPDVQSKLGPLLGYYDSMQVWQANSPATLTFTSRDIEDDPTSKDLYLGACVEDQPLVCALWEQLQNHDVNAVTTNAKTSVDCYTNVSSLESVGIGNVGSLATVTMHDGKKLEAAVLVGADGGNSFVRKATGISRVGLEYEQHALTFTVELDSAAGSTMERRAFQRYLSDGGPMALLPTYSPNHAVIVWSTSPDNISTWKDAADEDLVAHLNQCLREGPQRVPPLFEALTGSSSGGDGGHSTTTATPTILSNLAYGADRVLDTVHYGLAMASHHPDPTFRVPPVISKIVSRKFTFPLSCFQATTYVKGRVALVGDAAHSVHPMAGQGLNLGLGDVDSLVNSLEKAARAGMDLSSFLQEYNTQRHRSVSVSLAGIHALQRMFRNQTAPLQHAKTFGMNMIQNFGPMRRRLAVAAAHGVAL